MTEEPAIVALCCNWCGYTAADQAGAAKIPYPSAGKIVPLLCTGLVDPHYVLRAFERGFDGVLVIGCHPGQCHYKSGNLQAREQTDPLLGVLPTLGIGPERLRLDAPSSSEGPRFAEIANEFTETIRKLGPSPLREVA